MKKINLVGFVHCCELGRCTCRAIHYLLLQLLDMIILRSHWKEEPRGNWSRLFGKEIDFFLGNILEASSNSSFKCGVWSQLVWLSWSIIPYPKGFRFDSQWGRMPRLQVRSNPGTYRRQLRDASLSYWCFSLSLHPSLKAMKTNVLRCG